MTTISGIFSAGGPYTEPQSKRNTGVKHGDIATSSGPDTVFISKEALRMAGRYADDGDESNGLAGIMKEDDSASSGAATAKTSQNQARFLSMLMESLFLAELEDSGSGAPRAESGTEETEQTQAAQPKNAPNPLRDGGKAALIKKGISDFISGKAGLDDLPGLMAAGGAGMKGGSSASGSVITDKADLNKI